MKLFRAAGIVMAVSLVSAGLGVAREMVIASRFGTSSDTDAFFFANDIVVRFPEFVIPAIAGALVPLYIRAKASGSGMAFVSTTITSIALFSTAAAVALFLLAPAIADGLGSGFPPSTRETVATMVRILSPAMAFLGVAFVLRTLLEAEERFVKSQSTQLFLSLGVIVAVLIGAPTLGIMSLPIGILGVTLLQLAWTAWWLRSSSFVFRPTVRLADPRFRRFLRLLWPGLLGSVLLWMIPVLDKVLASRLSEGAVAALSFGMRPVTVLERLAIQSLVIAGLPVFAWKALDTRREALADSVGTTIRMMLYLLVPLSLIIAVLRVPIITVLFERGEFTRESTVQSAGVLAAAALGLPWMAVAVISSTVFRSIEDTKTPAFYGAGGNLLMKAIFSPVFVALLGAAGLALATSAMYAGSAVILLTLLHRRVLPLPWRDLGSGFFRSAVASGLAVLPVALLVEATSLGPLPMLVTGGALGVSLYLGAGALLGAPEPRELMIRIRSRKPRPRIPA